MAGQDTGGVHLAQGVLGGVNGDIVVIQHGVAAAEVDGIKVVLALGSGELCLGTTCREGTAQLDAHLLHLGALGFLDGDGVPAAGVRAQQLHLHQLDVGVLARADAGEGSGGTVFRVPRTTCTTVRLLPALASTERTLRALGWAASSVTSKRAGASTLVSSATVSAWRTVAFSSR